MGLQVVEHVTQSQYALQLLLPQGDYAGALDIIDDIQVSTAALPNIPAAADTTAHHKVNISCMITSAHQDFALANYVDVQTEALPSCLRYVYVYVVSERMFLLICHPILHEFGQEHCSF